jgi:protein-S-isoprenylcysteine O-methyltransferase Ste14
MVGVFIIGLPHILSFYELIDGLDYRWDSIQFQILLIIGFPGLVASYDLVTKGKGTPFPYDSTQLLVETGVYAYCRNPIQWSFTMLFIPLSIYHSSPFLLIGFIVSVGYTLGVSDYQEHPDMEKRFGDKWKNYKQHIPNWRFLWKPRHIPEGTVYFDSECSSCSQFRNWFEKQKAHQLVIKSANQFQAGEILQVTYTDHHGNNYKSVEAIAHCLEHINLAYATLGWFMRMPIIRHILQAIIDPMEFPSDSRCNIDN